MRLATFNVENLFRRAAIMNLPTWAEGRPVLEDYARLTNLIQRPKYTEAAKREMLEIMGRHKGLVANRKSEFIILRDIRKKLVSKRGNRYEIGVDGRGDWIGWFELETTDVKETAIENTARVFRELKADIVCVVEAEDRIGLKRFNDAAIPRIGGEAFEHVMLIDGNDDRGIDVGLVARAGYPILSVVSHVDDRDEEGIVFSRDCAEYLIQTPSGEKLLVMVNHLKSKGYGRPGASDAKRMRQARRLRELYEERLNDGYDHIAIAGDFNDTPDSEPLAPLLKNGSNLTDVMAHPRFEIDDPNRPGTYGNGTKSGKLDYILMSPKLSAKIIKAGIERRGVWGGKHGTLFPHFEEMKSEKDAASDHAALWVEIDL